MASSHYKLVVLLKQYILTPHSRICKVKTPSLAMESINYASDSSSETKKMTTQRDGLQNLPADVLENIISFCPIKEAITCGLISKRFLESWRFCRDLSFDELDFERFADEAEIFNFIQRIMDEHSGPVIEKLGIFLDPTEKENEILDWIRKATAKGVKELYLNFLAGIVPFVLPCDILDGASLQVLNLGFCDIGSLKTFNALRYLKTITLEDLHLPRAFSEAIFTNCLLLENFEVWRCHSTEYILTIDGSQSKNLKNLKVIEFHDLLHVYMDVPTLQVFHYVGEICHIVSKCQMTNIVESVLHFHLSTDADLFPGVENFMIALRSTKYLSISRAVFERLCYRFFDFENKDFQFCLRNLKQLHLQFGEPILIVGKPTFFTAYHVIFFLSKALNLQDLTIDLGKFCLESAEYWGKLADFMFLKSVCLVNFKFFGPEIQMAKLLIEKCKVLERCIIWKTEHSSSGAKEDEVNFLQWLATQEKPKVQIYEQSQ